jgi:small subunit ribosomal protein S13
VNINLAAFYYYTTLAHSTAMHLLGHYLPDHKPLRIALRAFYGISYPTASRLLARLQIPDQALVASLTETQITSLSAYLSSPSTSAKPAPTPVAAPGAARVAADAKGKSVATSSFADPLANLQIETDLRRQRHGDINHHRLVGTYKGRRHAMGLPVRGQNTRNNAQTAAKLNSLNRRRFG